MSDYKTENVKLAGLSGMDSEDAESMIGKTISSIEGSEYGIILHFLDGTSFEAQGHTYDGCSLSVFLNN